jgi:hypothetical protein
MAEINDWAIVLGTAHKSELLAMSALDRLVTKMPSRDPRQVMSTSLAVHTERAHQLSDLRGPSLDSNLEELVIPAKLQSILGKNNVPERLMFAWLHEFESRLLDHYEDLAASCPSDEKVFFDKIVEEQRELVEKTWDVTQRLTAVIDPGLWDDETQFAADSV